jgi:hypothetical protein
VDRTNVSGVCKLNGLIQEEGEEEEEEEEEK